VFGFFHRVADKPAATTGAASAPSSIAS
jgi:hypothetical protein